MSDVKWIKLSVNMFNDEKIKLIRTMPEGEKIIVTWIQLLCLAGKTNDHGGIYMGQNIYYTDEMLATLCDQPINIMRIALKTLEQFGMIEWNGNGLIQITNWEKHQSTDKMARMKEQTRIRQQKYYYRNKLRELGLNVDTEGFTDDLDELKDMLEELEKPHVRLTLANDTEVRSKKLEVRSKNIDQSSAKLTEDFEKLWGLYPNKQGKKKAFDSYRKAIKAGTSNKQIQDGIVAYKKYLKREEWQKPAHGSTWFYNERWNDDYNAQDVIKKPKISIDEQLRQGGVNI